jgi:transcriptional regulator with XRE-family HTH domain
LCVPFFVFTFVNVKNSFVERGKQRAIEKMMKERILQIMRRENMTQQEFAKAIEVSPASLSNIFNGKTNPTNNHVSAIHRRFPDININWLMFGEGDMYATVSDETKDSVNGGESTIKSGAEKAPIDASGEPMLFDISDPEQYAAWARMEDIKDVDDQNRQIPVVREVVKYVDKPQRKITEIRIFFDDGTFEVFS